MISRYIEVSLNKLFSIFNKSSFSIMLGAPHSDYSFLKE